MTDDPMARLRAQNDQAKEGAREYAGTLWAFYGGLTAEGFKPEQALALTITFLSAQLGNASNGKTD